MSTQITFDANAADTQRIAQWLRTALDGYINDDLGRWAFEPLEQHIGDHDDLAADLCAVYKTLTAAAQEGWRQAIRDLLATLGRDRSKRQATQVLIDVAVLARVSEVLDVLPSLIGSDDDTMLNQVVQAATALASQTEASLTCLQRIRTSHVFSSDYAGIILIALCHVDPDGWLDHVNSLVVPMQRLMRLLPPESTAPRFYANNILRAIGLSRITSPALNCLADQGMTWLLQEWFEGDQSLLEWEPSNAGGGRLVLRSNDSVCTLLDSPLVPSVLSFLPTDVAWRPRRASDEVA